jgi:hypothetical protein
VNVIQNPNAALLLDAVQKLEPLLDQIAFVGGCVTGLLITDPAAAPVRPTIDVDAIFEIAAYADLAAWDERVLALGFHRMSAEGAPICRWVHQQLILDLMPTDPKILGFANEWYPAALANAGQLSIGNYKARVITSPYFLATKLEAFHARGRNDYRLSRDLEDIVTVVDGRPELVAEVRQNDAKLRNYMADELSNLLSSRDFLEALPGYLLPDAPSQQRIAIIVRRLNQIASGE